MTGKVIKIDENKCVGCGLCASACKEGAIGMVDGKAKLLREDHCDGLGNCLPVCPVNAISFQERDVKKPAVKVTVKPKQPETLACGCPGTHSKPIARENSEACTANVQTHLNQWPVQIKLVPPGAPYFNNADLLVAADCSAYAYGNFHNDYMKNRITVIGCPKLDDADYAQKLTDILKQNDIKSVTVTRMDVPCCSGIENAARTALKHLKHIPLQIVTISTDGKILGVSGA